MINFIKQFIKEFEQKSATNYNFIESFSTFL